MLVFPRCRGDHDICFLSEIIWILEVKLKENVISSLAWDSVIKFDATTVHSVGIRLLYAEEEKTKPITNQAVYSAVLSEYSE